MLGLSQDDSPCILLPGQALPLKQPRISRLSRPQAPLDSWRIQMTFGLCGFNAARRQGQEQDEGRNVGSVSEGQPEAGEELFTFYQPFQEAANSTLCSKRVRLSPLLPGSSPRARCWPHGSPLTLGHGTSLGLNQEDPALSIRFFKKDTRTCQKHDNARSCARPRGSNVNKKQTSGLPWWRSG